MDFNNVNAITSSQRDPALKSTCTRPGGETLTANAAQDSKPRCKAEPTITGLDEGAALTTPAFHLQKLYAWRVQ